MVLSRKNNALTNDVVAMYDAVAYGERADEAIQQSAPSGGVGGTMPQEAPLIVKVFTYAAVALYELLKKN